MVKLSIRSLLMRRVIEDRCRKASITLRYKSHEKVTELRTCPVCATFGRMWSLRV